MKWIELIRVRSSAVSLEEAMPSLLKLVKEVEDASNDAETFFMQHAIYDGDLAIVIVWLNDTDPHKTHQGLIIAERVQELGSVEHAVWIPVEKHSLTTIKETRN